MSVFAIICVSLSANVHGAVSEEKGLSTSFADVLVDPVVLGTTTPVRQAGSDAMILRNLGSRSIHVKVEILVPTPSQLKDGALALGDPKWVRAEPNELDLPPHGEGRCHVTLLVPDDDAFRRTTYQAMIWTHEVASRDGGVAINAALLSRLRFRTGEKIGR